MLYFYLIATLVLLVWLYAEYLFLRTARQKLPLRIMINGTRGKSSLVRLVHEILSKSGQTVFAKTTGDKPITIDADGNEHILRRLGPASIIENVRWLYRIAKHNPDAVVLECMALQPETQRILANQIFKPHYTLITNIYRDHAEVMGQTVKEMSRTIGECFFPNTHTLLDARCADSFHNAGVKLPEYTIPEKTAHWTMKINGDNAFPVEIFEQQRLLLHGLGQKLNIRPELIDSVLNEAWQRNNTLVPIEFPQNNHIFFNLFSVNDTESSGYLLKLIRERYPDSNLILILNTRRDRPLRTRDFCELINQSLKPDGVWLTGNGRRLAGKYLNKRISFDSLNSGQVKQRLENRFEKPVILIGIGNHQGTESLFPAGLSPESTVERNPA